LFSSLLTKSKSSLLSTSLIIIGIEVLFFLVLVAIIYIFYFFLGARVVLGLLMGVKWHCLI
jgi:hypothetical protein